MIFNVNDYCLVVLIIPFFRGRLRSFLTWLLYHFLSHPIGRFLFSINYLSLLTRQTGSLNVIFSYLFLLITLTLCKIFFSNIINFFSIHLTVHTISYTRTYYVSSMSHLCSLLFLLILTVILILIMILMKISSRYSLFYLHHSTWLVLAVKYLKFDTLSMIIILHLS